MKEITQEYSVEWDSSSTEAEFNKKHEDLLVHLKNYVQNISIWTIDRITFWNCFWFMAHALDIYTAFSAVREQLLETILCVLAVSVYNSRNVLREFC